MAANFVRAFVLLSLLAAVSAPAWAQEQPPAQGDTTGDTTVVNQPPAQEGDTTVVNNPPPQEGDTTNVNVEGPTFLGLSGMAFWVMVLVVVVVLALLLVALAAGGHHGGHY